MLAQQWDLAAGDIFHDRGEEEAILQDNINSYCIIMHDNAC